MANKSRLVTTLWISRRGKRLYTMIEEYHQVLILNHHGIV